MKYVSKSRKAFLAVNNLALILLTLICFAPILNTLAMSLSDSAEVAGGRVTFWPVRFTLDAYEFILTRSEFFNSLLITLERLALGTTLQMVLTVLCAYPLSKENSQFTLRTVYVWIFVFTMLFGAGVVPAYLNLKNARLLGTIWALVLPGAVSVYNVLLLLNAFRGLPRALEESFCMDGAGHIRTMLQLYVPLSKPTLATLLLFTMVAHWNSWFDGMLYMNNPEDYPLATYLRSIIVSFDFTKVTSEDAYLLARISTRTSKCAQIIVAMLPIMMVYPFLQKHFVKGIVLGSVKG